MRHHFLSKNSSGFTLVELAIVLMIIGLLIGGILRGQEMYNNTKVTKTIQTVDSYRAALSIFQDAYAGIPGDLITASQRIAGCQDGNGNSCQNGDGNGVLGEPAAVFAGGQHLIATENTQFWKHLALAHLISGVNANASQPAWGKSHPASIFPGGFTVVTAIGGGGGQTMSGSIALRLHGCLTCSNAEASGGNNTSPVSPKQALQIDRKMDDGKPRSGSVQASAYGNGALVADCEQEYNETREDPFCVMAFVLKR